MAGRRPEGVVPFPPLRSERIPAELWLQIIEPSLEQDDITRLSLVSKHLRYIAQPMLFSEIRVTLVQARNLHTPALVRCQHVHYNNRLKERLEFITSNRAAYFVKTLTINTGSDIHVIGTQDAVKEEEVLRTVFNQLPHFVNLRSFSAQDISLNGSHFDSLAQLEHFNGIHLERCKCSGDLRLTRFRLRYLSLHGKMHGSYGWWIPLVTASSVEHLSYDAPVPLPPAENEPQSEPEVLFPALTVLPRPLLSLRTLRLPAHAPFFPCFVGALARCSSVENLYIDQRHAIPSEALDQLEDEYPVLSHNILPKLKAISAPTKFIECLIMSRTDQVDLKHISICDQFSDVTEILQLIRDRCQGVEELVIAINTTTSLDLLLTQLPFLRGLFVVTGSIHIPYKEVRTSSAASYTLLLTARVQLYQYLKTVIYPPNLRCLHIKSLQGSRRHSSALSTSSPGTPAKTRSALVSHIRKHAPKIVEVEILLKKSIMWRDMYTSKL